MKKNEEMNLWNNNTDYLSLNIFIEITILMIIFI